MRLLARLGNLVSDVISVIHVIRINPGFRQYSILEILIQTIIKFPSQFPQIRV